MRFISLLITVFIDSLGFGLVFPIFSPLIMNPEQSFLPLDTSVSMRGWLFGILVASFCVGQFFGGPVLGALSDRKGRKKILILTLWMAFGTYVLAGLGITIGSILLLFFARVLGGVAASNWSVAQSIIVDSSTEADKGKNFGLLGMAWGTGFIIGPFVGGRLAEISMTAPFWFAAILCLCNSVLLMWKLEETLPSTQLTKVNLLASIHHLKKAFTTPRLKVIFLMMFIVSLGWGFFTEFSSIFLLRHLNFTLAEIGNFYACIGLWIAISQGLLIRPFLSRFSPQVLLPCALIGLGLVLIPILFVTQGWGIYFIIPFLAFFESFIFPSASTIVSNLSPKEAQGEFLGIHNSIQWAAIGFTPLFSGSIVAHFPHLPITIASISMFLAFIVFLKGVIWSSEKLV